MRKNNMICKRSLKFKVTTDSNYNFPISKNYLNQDFKVERINQVWVSDITYIRTSQGWLYLTIILDLFDRQVIGWALSSSLKTKATVIPIWKMAIKKRKITKKLTFHPDRGVQYASGKFRNYLNDNPKVTQSMSRKANY